jgi:hypothetical protein
VSLGQRHEQQDQIFITDNAEYHRIKKRVQHYQKALLFILNDDGKDQCSRGQKRNRMRYKNAITTFEAAFPHLVHSAKEVVGNFKYIRKADLSYRKRICLSYLAPKKGQPL